MRSLGATHVCRSLDTGMSQCEMPVGEVPAGKIAESPKGKNQAGKTSVKNEVSFTDTIPPELQQQNATKALTYAVSVPNADDHSAGISNKVQIPAAATLPPPADFKAQVTADGVVLNWTPLVTQETAGSSHGYRVYRKEEGKKGETLVGEVPLGEAANQLVDHSFEWQKNYSYRGTVATEVSLGMHPCKEGAAPAMDCATVAFVEGDDTPTVEVSTNDVFPPAVPSGLQAAFSGPGQQPFIDLIWAPDIEADLAGYNIYRREENGQPTKVNSELVKTPAFRDSKVDSGKTYFYSISAVDLRHNEGARSEETSESVP